jgi:CubicO group peptidase (beta-lactamase class C family)
MKEGRMNQDKPGAPGFALLAFFLLFVSGCATTVIPRAGSPEEVGISSAQLGRIETVTSEHMKAGLLPGAVMLVARNGKIAWYKTMGYRDRDAGDEMKPDSIFRIYSMTKPMVSIATMMLVEEGRLQLSDPVSRYLPEMKGIKVGVEKAVAGAQPTLSLVDPQREMTVHDLLRHTSGLVYGGRAASAVNAAYQAARIGSRDVNNRDFVSKVSRLPLRFSPGTRWEYGISTDVLGRVLEVIENKPLSQVLDERLIRPLGMVDTAFFVPAEKLQRAAQPWHRPGVAQTPRFDVAEKPAFESGGGGLVSTMDDYLRFATMLLNGGEFAGKRYVSKSTIALMASDHTGGVPGLPPGVGFGLGFDVRIPPSPPPTLGEYGWSGNAGTRFWVDPKHDLIAIYMVQVADGDRMMLRNQFQSMVREAIMR